MQDQYLVGREQGRKDATARLSFRFCTQAQFANRYAYGYADGYEIVDRGRLNMTPGQYAAHHGDR
jgi:hypothetical protein